MRRLLICLALLLVTVAGLEWHYGRELDRFEADGGTLPPFGRDRSPEYLEQLRDRIAVHREREPKSVKGKFDPRYGWINVQGKYRLQGSWHHLNSIGARGLAEFGDAAPEGARRVVCIGDSFTYGTEVKDGQDWPTLIHERADDLEVINLGMGGWALDQTYLLWQDRRAELDADVVIVGIYVGGIARNVNRFRPLLYVNDPTPSVKPRYRLDGEELVLVPQPFGSRLAVLEALVDDSLFDTLADHEFWAGDEPAIPWSKLSTLIASRRAHERRALPNIYKRTSEEPFQVTRALGVELANSIRASGAEPLIVFFPPKRSFVFPEDMWEEHAYWRSLYRAYEEAGVPCLDLYGALFAEGKGDLYALEHLNALGNRVAAEQIESWLRAK